MNTALEELYQSLNQRRRPEDIAQLILTHFRSNFNEQEIQILEKPAKHSLQRSVWGYTSMLQDFPKPVSMGKQIHKSEELFGIKSELEELDYSDPDMIEGYIKKLNQDINKAFAKNDFKEDRLNKSQRLEMQLDMSKRRYNKLFRVIARMEKRLDKLIIELRKLKFQKVSKSSLASKILHDDFINDIPTACFIAYYTARANIRSEFTIDGQQRPYDEVADALFQKCLTGEHTNWYAISYVFSNQKVLAHLTEQQKHQLLSIWYTLLEEISDILESTWNKSEFRRKSMVVQKGNDSSTWNSSAGAWNKVRDSWINLVYSLGLEEMLDYVCPGKVMRLMAGDVAYWHIQSGGTIDPNTNVWNELPLPWEVLKGEKSCTKNLIFEACKKHGLDPEESGWIAPRPTHMAQYRPTPELVHGVTIGHPYLAMILKKNGWFSGKS